MRHYALDETDYGVLALVVIVGGAWLLWGSAAVVEAVVWLGGVVTLFSIYRTLTRP